MPPEVWAPVGSILLIIGAIYLSVTSTIRLRARLAQTPSPDVTARLEALERDVQNLQQELADTQERLDFAERVLTKAAEERRLGG